MSTAELLQMPDEVIDPPDVMPAPPPRGEDLPYDDGEPLESHWHRQAMNLLCESVDCMWEDRDDFFVGGNMFIHFSLEQVFNKDFRGPDFFAVLGVERFKDRKSWVAWEEGGRYPDVVIELVSETTAKNDRVIKKKLYSERWRTAEYYCYDPVGPLIEGWKLVDGRYQPLELQNGRLWSYQLGVFLGSWKGQFLQREGIWPRFFYPDGRLVPIFWEKERAKVEAEKQRAEAEKQRAEAEKQRADQAEAELAALRLQLELLKSQIPPTS
jgi:Uma2 family endonuclease